MVHLSTIDVAAQTAVEVALGRIEEAVAIAREIGWRGGEAFVFLDGAYCYQAVGDLGRAVDSARRSLAIAEEIGHRQWEAAATFALGGIAVDLRAYEAAERLLRRAAEVADAARSSYWGRFIALITVAAHLGRGEIKRAEAALDAIHRPDAPKAVWFDRLGWLLRAELALAKDDPARALDAVDDLIATALQPAAPRAIPTLWLSRGKALAAQGRNDEATAILREAAGEARTRQGRTLLWQILLALGRVELQRGKRPEAERALDEARAVIAEIAATLPEGPIPEFGLDSAREHFLAATAARFPAQRQPTALQAAKQAYGGLTARERDVAALIARGLSNRAIAEELIVGERTVATHVTSILAKLDFTSRSQIAAWAVERGLTVADPERHHETPNS
jgi:DNA-binding CsgD family transcriptional regulator